MMKITGTSSYIDVEIDGKTVQIEGELLIGGFVAYKDTIKHWEPPYEHIEITDKEKEDIIKRVTDYTKNSHFVVEFE